MIPFNVPPFTGNEMKYIREAVDNQKICGDGPFTKRCSAWMEEHTGTSRALLTTSCTHANELAVLLLDLQPGDEVIMPSFTFVSSADAYVLRGVVPVFVDIRPDTMNIDENLIEDAITERTKAIEVVHYAGVGCNMTSFCSSESILPKTTASFLPLCVAWLWLYMWAAIFRPASLTG